MLGHKKFLYKEERRRICGNVNAGICAFMREMNFGEKWHAVRLHGGINCHVYKVLCKKGDFLFKYYHGLENDSGAHRLNNEIFFSRFVWDQGIRSIPKPITHNVPLRFAVYEYIKGKKLREEDINAALVCKALKFFHAVNKFKYTDAAKRLGNVAEACFSVEEHIKTTSARLKKLSGITVRSAVEKNAEEFIVELKDQWRRIQAEIYAHARHSGLDPRKELGRDERCLSPSDFGFHNAVRQDDGRIKFIDFEYAGWDDPAKTINDFFCQPEIPVPIKFYDIFSKSVLKGIKNIETHQIRSRILMGAYKIKWCCILLNCFTESGRHKLLFSPGNFEENILKKIQLAKAEKMLASHMQKKLFTKQIDI